MLLKWRMRPTLCDSGAAALDILCRRARLGEKFDLVLLDGQMPGMDGFAVAREIQAEPAALAGPRIMMLSSVDMPSALRAGDMDPAHCVMKPVTRANLLGAILKAVGHPRTGSPPLRSASSDSGRPLRVLVAEDNPVNQRVAILLLKNEGHSVVLASNGEEAVEASDREPFDLILMDVQMPVMNGYEATRAIREREGRTGKHTPIVALTAHAMKGDCETCVQAGMDDYLSKPIQSRELRETVVRWSHQNHTEPSMTI
jgi:CheY-like chemotaxis protein